METYQDIIIKSVFNYSAFNDSQIDEESYTFLTETH